MLPCGWRNEGQWEFEAYGVFWPILVLRLLNFTTERPSCILPSSVITAPETPFSPSASITVFRCRLTGFIFEGVTTDILEKELG